MDKSLKAFFRYLIIGYLISAVRADWNGKKPSEILWLLFLIFSYNLIVGVWTGVAAMFGVEVYNWLKKNSINERLLIILRGR